MVIIRDYVLLLFSQQEFVERKDVIKVCGVAPGTYSGISLWY